MNLSHMVKRMKMELGIYAIALPIDDLDGMIVDIIKTITLPVYSMYNPYTEKMYVNLRNWECKEHMAAYDCFMIPDFTNRKLLYVKDINYDDRSLSGMGYWGGGIPYIHGSLVNQMMISNAGAQLGASMLPKLTFKFVHPRTLYIYNLIASHNVVIDMAFEHDQSLQSINPTSEESFYQLAILDVKMNLYATIKHYNEIQTAYGTINLNIEDWQNAASERKDKIEQMDNDFHLDLAQLIYV